MAISNYQDLIVWQKSMDLAVECYKVMECFPKIEMYGLCSQMRRAVVSISSNISEGQGRIHTREFIHHLGIANGSRCELETQLLLSARIGYLNTTQIDPLLALSAEIGRMLHSLIKRLEERL